jgi:hypothetical protein
MATRKQLNNDAEPSSLERVRRLTATPGGKPGGKPPPRSDARAWRLFVLANHGGVDPETGQDLTMTRSQATQR